jgi:hypothetical protein
MIVLCSRSRRVRMARRPDWPFMEEPIRQQLCAWLRRLGTTVTSKFSIYTLVAVQVTPASGTGPSCVGGSNVHDTVSTRLFGKSSAG